MDVQVFVPDSKSKDDGVSPTEIPFLGGWESGLRLSHPEPTLLDFGDIQLISIFTSHAKERGRHLFAFFAEGQDKPLLIELSKIQFTDFSGIPDATPALTCRKFVYHVCKNAGKIFIDRGTYAFLKGQPPQKLSVPVDTHITACGQKLHEAAPVRRTESSREPLEMDADAQSVELDTDSGEADGASANLMTCPNCRHQQPVNPECVQCGIIVEKFQKKRARDSLDGEETAETSMDSGSMPIQNREVIPEPILQVEPQPVVGGPVASEYGLGEAYISIDSAFTAVFRLILPELKNLFLIGTPPLLVMIGVLAGLGATGPQDPGISMVIWSVFLSVLAMTFFSFQMISLTHYIDAVTEDEPCSVLASYKAGFYLLMSALPSRLLATLLTLLGFLCFFVPGLIYTIRFCFIESILAVQKKPPAFASAAHMSRNLMERYGFSVGGSLIMAYALVYLCIYAVILLLALTPIVAKGFLSFFGEHPILLGILAFLICLFLMAAVAIFHAGLLFVLARELMAIKGDEYEKPREGFSNLTIAVLAIDAIIVLWVVLKSFAGS